MTGNMTGNSLEVLPGTPGFVALDLAGDVQTSRQKYPVLITNEKHPALNLAAVSPVTVWSILKSFTWRGFKGFGFCPSDGNNLVSSSFFFFFHSI